MDWNTVLQVATLVAVISVGMWAGTINAKIEQHSKALEQLTQLATQLSRDIAEVRVALAALRAELFEKFQPRAHI